MSASVGEPVAACHEARRVIRPISKWLHQTHFTVLAPLPEFDAIAVVEHAKDGSAVLASTVAAGQRQEAQATARMVVQTRTAAEDRCVTLRTHQAAARVAAQRGRRACQALGMPPHPPAGSDVEPLMSVLQAVVVFVEGLSSPMDHAEATLRTATAALAAAPSATLGDAAGAVEVAAAALREAAALEAELLRTLAADESPRSLAALLPEELRARWAAAAAAGLVVAGEDAVAWADEELTMLGPVCSSPPSGALLRRLDAGDWSGVETRVLSAPGGCPGALSAAAAELADEPWLEEPHVVAALAKALTAFGAGFAALAPLIANRLPAEALADGAAAGTPWSVLLDCPDAAGVAAAAPYESGPGQRQPVAPSLGQLPSGLPLLPLRAARVIGGGDRVRLHGLLPLGAMPLAVWLRGASPAQILEAATVVARSVALGWAADAAFVHGGALLCIPCPPGFTELTVGGRSCRQSGGSADTDVVSAAALVVRSIVTGPSTASQRTGPSTADRNPGVAFESLWPVAMAADAALEAGGDVVSASDFADAVLDACAAATAGVAEGSTPAAGPSLTEIPETALAPLREALLLSAHCGPTAAEPQRFRIVRAALVNDALQQHAFDAKLAELRLRARRRGEDPVVLPHTIARLAQAAAPGAPAAEEAVPGAADASTAVRLLSAALHRGLPRVFADVTDSDQNELFLLHGTGEAAARRIAVEGFDERVAGDANLFGAGTYLTNTLCKAHQYAFPGAGPARRSADQKSDEAPVLVVARAAMGDALIVSRAMHALRRPPDRAGGGRYDSVIGNGKHHKEFVLYDRGQVLPVALVWYTLD